ncbi:hypothetical protein F5B20DRAFT_575690 [Whalleya microplaca]|nr:hypothetical protein F5B20DRAFT_575690 [Whalleya microplaca]
MASPKSGTNNSEPEYAKSQDRAKALFYHPNIEHRLVPEMQELQESATKPRISAHTPDGATLMDVGTYFDDDLCQLVYDGAPSNKLYGVDIANRFDIGFDFFRDRGHFKDHYMEANISSTTPPELMALKGRVDMVVASQILHQ